MAKTQGVWGIDIGQCAIKALRCLPGQEPGTIIADAFDYIEYPKILSQPESNPEELIAEALQQFLSRNQVKGDKVAISVPGQNGLARFVKLPPVELKKIPDLVRYEARNQIPFDLDEVIWDYQQMGGGMIEEGFAIDIEMGLFAMKREQVQKSLRPFQEAKIDVDIVQLTPLALYNFAVFDQLRDSMPAPELYDPENPPPSVMILSLGTETTDLVITDGFRVWQRSLPVGGSHFTKALTKELKQTFAKAEHIKRNAAQAENPKALFQAMRPIFADLVTEVQRSMNFFSNVHKKANIVSGIALGSTGKLPGLVRFLSQNLKMPITRVESFRGLRGPGIVDAPAFQENMLAFPVCYGLCLQGLGESAIQTNLVPRELLVERMINAKKPWAAGAIAALALALAISFAGHWQNCLTVREERFKKAEQEVNQAVTLWTSDKSAYDSKETAFKQSTQIGDHLVLARDKMLRWSRLYRAIDACIPREMDDKVEFKRRNEIFITAITSERKHFAEWYARATSPEAAESDGTQMSEGGQQFIAPGGGGGAKAPAPGAGQQTGPASATAGAPQGGPTGKGFVIRIEGHHFHNLSINEGGTTTDSGAEFVKHAFIKNLEKDQIQRVDSFGKPLVDQATKMPIMIAVKKQGIAFPTILPGRNPDFNSKVKNPFYNPDLRRPDGTNDEKMNPEYVVRYDFVVEFAWLDSPPPEPATNPENTTVASATPSPAPANGNGSSTQPAILANRQQP